MRIRIADTARTLIDRFSLSAMGRRVAAAYVKQAGMPVMERIVSSLGAGFGGTDPSAWRDIQAYRVHSWVYTAVKIISQNIAQIPLVIHRVTVKAGKQVKEPLPDHPIIQLINAPNPHMTGAMLKYQTMAHLELTGDAFWWLVRFGNEMVPSWIIGLKPDRVRIVPSKTTFISHYEYRVGAEVINIVPEEIIHFKYFNPDDDYRGQGTLQAARDTVNLDISAKRFNKNFFKNGAHPGLAIQFKQTLTRPERKAIRESFRADHVGVDQAHNVAIVEGAESIKELRLNQRDMEFFKLMGMTRNEIGSVFGIPKIMFNADEGGVFNNEDRQVQFFWHETAIPKLFFITDQLTMEIPKFLGSGATRFGSGLEIDADLSRNWALQREQMMRVKSEGERIKDGRLTVNESRQMDNLEPFEGGDTHMRTTTLIPFDTPAPSQGSPAQSAVSSVPSPVSDSNVKGVSVVTVGADRAAEAKIAQWKAFIVNTDFFESRFGGMVRSFMEDQLRETLRNLRRLQREIAGVDADLLAGPDGWIDATVKRKLVPDDADIILFDVEAAVEAHLSGSAPIYKRIVKKGGELGFEQAGVDAAFNVEDPRTLRRMLEKQQTFAESVPNTTWTKTRASLVEGLEAGESFSSLADRVQETMGDRIKSSPQTIARTEVIGAANGGLLDGFEQSNVVKLKSWLDSQDSNVRSSHVDLGGRQAIPIKDKWTVTDTRSGLTSRLEYPGDPGGGAAQVANCRCSMRAVLKTIDAPIGDVI